MSAGDAGHRGVGRAFAGHNLHDAAAAAAADADADADVRAAELRDLVGAFVRAFGLHDADRTPCGQPMSVSEAHALTELRRGPLRQVELGRRLRLEKSTVSRLVGQLVQRGWAVRDPAPDDGRGVAVQLTEAGGSAADRVLAAREQRFAALLARIPETRRAEVVRALQTLAEAADGGNK